MSTAIKVGRLYKKKNDDRNHMYILSKRKRGNGLGGYAVKVIYIFQDDPPTANSCVVTSFDDFQIRMYYELVEDV